jgi:hypothetical protein
VTSKYQIFHKEDDLDFEPSDEDVENLTTKDGEEISQSSENITTAKGNLILLKKNSLPQNKRNRKIWSSSCLRSKW